LISLVTATIAFAMLDIFPLLRPAPVKCDRTVAVAYKPRVAFAAPAAKALAFISLRVGMGAITASVSSAAPSPEVTAIAASVAHTTTVPGADSMAFVITKAVLVTNAITRTESAKEYDAPTDWPKGGFH
jgi:hypothetical protein